MRKLAALVALAFAVLLLASACGGGGIDRPSKPVTRFVLEANVASLAVDADPAEVMADMAEVLRRRLDAGGWDGDVVVEGDSRLIVTTEGLTLEDGRIIIGRTGLVNFRQPILYESLDMACVAPDGSQFPAPTSMFAVAIVDGERVAQCFSEAGETGGFIVGELLWEPATGTDSRGEEMALNGRFLRPNVSVSANPATCQGNPSCVIIEFTPDGGLLFQEITGRLIGLPLGIFLDEDLLSAPVVQSQISGSSSVITGLDLDEARRLRVQVNGGPPPVAITLIDAGVIEAE